MKKMKTKYLFTLLLIWLAISIMAKSYPFIIKHSYHIQVVRVAQQGNKYYKVWGEGSSVKKAIAQAMQDAVAASIFTGVPGTESAMSVPPICGSQNVYHEQKKYFDEFFKSGQFLQYVQNVNSGYPSGENNVKIGTGRRVALYVIVRYDALRKKLEEDGIIKGLNDYF